MLLPALFAPGDDAPGVSIDAVPAGDEGAAVRLGAALTGGTYDGTPEYAWTWTAARSTMRVPPPPAWTRPVSNANAEHTVELTVTVRGNGNKAPSGTSDTVSASQTAFVRAPNGHHGNSLEQATPVAFPIQIRSHHGGWQVLPEYRQLRGFDWRL